MVKTSPMTAMVGTVNIESVGTRADLKYELLFD
jgi:hypothetical protein